MFFIGRTYKSPIRKILGNHHSFYNTILTSIPVFFGYCFTKAVPPTGDYSFSTGTHSLPQLPVWSRQHPLITHWVRQEPHRAVGKRFGTVEMRNLLVSTQKKKSCGKDASAPFTECIGTFIFFLIAGCLFSPTTQPRIHTAKDGSWIDLNGFCHIQKYYSSLPTKIFL